jgi:hypothetical protein
MMKTFVGPIKLTIIWGLIGGLIYIPLCIGFSLFVRWPQCLQLTFWSLLVGYAVFLTHWSAVGLRSMGLPLLLLFVSAIVMQSMHFFLFSALAVLSWIRSGICFSKKPFVKRLGTEIILGSAIALPVAGAMPRLTAAWALGVLMFFLIQALYFVVLEPDFEPEPKIEVDAFEKARLAAENILDSAEKEIII